MTLRETENIETVKRNHQIALCGELVLEEATDVS
jgi:hypothetical protein